MPEKHDSEQVIVAKILLGNNRAVRRLYVVVAPKLKRVFCLKVADPTDVDELIQDTFLHFLDALPLFRFQSSLWTFISSIAKHELMDYWRKKYAKRVVRTVPLLKDLISQTYSSGQVSAAMHGTIERTYARLRPVQAQLLRWKYEEGRSVKEMASELGWSVKAVEAQLYRARKAFQVAYVGGEG